MINFWRRYEREIWYARRDGNPGFGHGADGDRSAPCRRACWCRGGSGRTSSTRRTRGQSGGRHAAEGDCSSDRGSAGQKRPTVQLTCCHLGIPLSAPARPTWTAYCNPDGTAPRGLASYQQHDRPRRFCLWMAHGAAAGHPSGMVRADKVMKSLAQTGSKNVAGPCMLAATSRSPFAGAASPSGVIGA